MSWKIKDLIYKFFKRNFSEFITTTLSGSDFEMRGVIINLSAGGCVVETSEDVEQGKYIILAFQIGSNFIQGIQGRLVRLKASTSATSEDFMSEKKSVNECVVSFNNVSADHEKVIVDFVMNAQRQFEVSLGLNEK